MLYHPLVGRDQLRCKVFVGVLDHPDRQAVRVLRIEIDAGVGRQLSSMCFRLFEVSRSVMLLRLLINSIQ